MNLSLPLRLAAALVALALAVPLPAAAQPTDACSRPSPSPSAAAAAVAAFRDLSAAGCFRGAERLAACSLPACAEAARYVEQAGKLTAEKGGQAAAAALRAVGAALAPLPADHLGAASMQTMLKRIALEPPTRPLTTADLKDADLPQWQVSTARPRLFRDDEALRVDFLPAIEQRCAAGAAPCQRAFDQALTLAQLAQAAAAVMTQVAKADVDRELADWRLLERRWRAYAVESRAIYLWEQWLNEKLLPTSTTGFERAQSRQYLFLHPSAGVVYRAGANGEPSNTRPLLAVDIFGIYEWSWAGPDSAEIARASGWALAAGWDGRRMSYGLGWHFSQSRSAYLMRDKDGRTMLGVSIDLGNYLLDKEKSVQKLRTRAEELVGNAPR